MRSARRSLRAATPRPSDAVRLPPIAVAEDDPVLAALCRLHGVSMTPLDGEAMVEHQPGTESRFPGDMPEFSFGPAGRRYTGQALVVFRTDPYIRYIRNVSGARIQIADDMLPATVTQGVAGMPVTQVVNVPGLEDWVVTHVGWDMIAQRHEIFIAPATGS